MVLVLKLAKTQGDSGSAIEFPNWALGSVCRWHSSQGKSEASSPGSSARRKLPAMGATPSCGHAACAKDSGAGSFAADDVVPLDHGGDSNGFLIVCSRASIDANHASVGADENFRAACDLSRQSEREIQLRAGGEVVLYGEVNTASGNIPCLAAVGPGLPINWQSDVHRQR